MLQAYRLSVPLGSPYRGQAGNLSAVVMDTGGNIAATIPTFTEVGNGEYEATVTLDTALPARIAYTWTGSPAIPFFPPDQKFPTGLPPDTTYPYPATLPLGPVYAGQADKVTAQALDTSGGVMADITPFVEVSPGLYEANPIFSSSWNGLVRYAWAGVPTIDLLPPDALAPASITGGSTTTLTALDHQGIVDDVITAIGYPNIRLFPYLITLVASNTPVLTGYSFPPIRPGDAATLSRQRAGLPPEIQLVQVMCAIHKNNAPITGIPDRTLTTVNQTTTTGVVSTRGRLTDPGTLAADGLLTAAYTFYYSPTETANLPPGGQVNYVILGVDTSGLIYTLEVGTWSPISTGL